MKRIKNLKKTKLLKSNKAITLVALVVTIIVLLILAGVSLNLILGNNGIIEKTKESKNVTEKDLENTYKALNSLYAEMVGALDEEPKEDTATKPYLPSSDYSQVSGTDLDTGLVIEDGQGNQYVWIEVPKIEEVYPTAKLAITEFTDAEYASIENDLHAYTNTYRNGTTYTDRWYAMDGSTLVKETDTTLTETQKALTNGCGLNYNDYINLRKAMLKSVYQNGGFWIGRYEAGISSPRTSRTDPIADNLKPTSKANEYPLYYVTCSEAQTLASKVAPTGYNSSLMFGVQWDLVLRYIEEKEVKKAVASGIAEATARSAVQEELKGTTTGGTEWGNYSNNTYNIDQTNAKQSTDNGANWSQAENKTVEGDILLTTGASEEFNKMNIYDLAGNVFEMTLEKTSTTTLPCTVRGGSYADHDSINPAFKRNRIITSNSSYTIGFRLALF